MGNNKGSKSIGFALLMLLSGFAGISYEILYGRILGDLIGDQFAVSAAILITFLLGIGIGSVFSHRLWHLLWLIEALIGLCALFFAFGNKLLDSLIYGEANLLPSGMTGDVLICIFLLIFPALLIGCSLPLFAGYLSRLNSGQVFSKAYAIYNVGAGLTALVIEFILLRIYGVCGSVLIIAVINGVLAFSLLFCFRELRQARPDKDQQPVKFTARQLAALILVSIGSAIFQLFMVKISELLLGPFRENFALVLSLVLFGIAAGSMLVRRFNISFQALLWMNLAGLILLACGLDPAINIYARLYASAAEYHLSLTFLKWLLLAILMGAPVITFGGTIPALLTRESDVARESGQLMFVASMANVAGFLLMAFFLHRFLDYGIQLLVVGAFSLLALLLESLKKRSFAVPLLAAAALSSCLLISYWKFWDEDLLYMSYTSFLDAESLKKERAVPNKRHDRFRGHQDVFSITWLKGEPFFFINGYISFRLNSPSEKLVGALSSIFAPRNDKALVLGLGSGATASTVGLLFDHTDAVEINPVVIENLYRMRPWSYGIENNPKVNIVVDDGIHFSKSTKTNYSLILNTVTTPLYFSSSKLYTRDFLEVVKQRLTLDGIYVTWVDSRIGNRGMDIILKTLSESFAHSALLYVKSAYFLIIASQQPVFAQQLDLVVNNSRISRDFWTNYLIDPRLIPYRVLGRQVERFIVDRSVPVNTADRPTLEFEMTRLRRLEDGFPKFLEQLYQRVNLEDASRPLSHLLEVDTFNFLLEANLALRNSPIPRVWEALLRNSTRDFEQRYDQVTQMYYENLNTAMADTAYTHHEHGLRLYSLKRYGEARRAFEQSLELDPGHNNGHLSLGLCFEALDEMDEALKHYALEQEYDPKDPDAPMLMAQQYLKQQRFQEALEQVNRAIRLKPDAVRFYCRGVIFEALNQPQSAVKDYMKAKESGGDPQEIDAALTRLQGKGN